MQSKKTGPAPIFNFRKRQRQAVVADPETHPSDDQKKVPHAAGNVSTPRPVTNRNNPPSQGRGLRSSALPAEKNFKKPAASAVLHSMVGAIAQSTRNCPPPLATTWKAKQSGGVTKAAQPSMKNVNQPALAQWEGRSAPPQSANRVKQQKTMETASVQAKQASAVKHKSLRVLTLPVCQFQRLLGVHNDSLPPLLFCMFGIVDSATVTDTITQGKAFTLGDETGRVKCVFCEIDRPMPRLHRRQWYRVVGIMKVKWGALQCLSLRPVGIEERQASRQIISQCQSILNNLCLGIMEQ